MTVFRIQGEGQYRLSAAAVDAANTLDAALEDALKHRDEPRFNVVLRALLNLVRDQEQLPLDSLEVSEVILPHADATMDEVDGLMAEEGLIPG